jgi:Tfp pilus assembly protein PilO
MKTNSLLIFIISFICFLLSCGGFLYMQFQIDQKINVIQEYYVQEKQNVNLYNFGNLNQEIQTLTNQENAIKRTFLSEDTLVSFIQEIDKYAQNNSLTVLIETINRSDMEQVAGNQSIQKIDFAVNVNGTYQDIKNFVQEIQSLPVIISVSDLKLYKTNTENSNTIYNGRVTLTGSILFYE